MYKPICIFFKNVWPCHDCNSSWLFKQWMFWRWIKCLHISKGLLKWLSIYSNASLWLKNIISLKLKSQTKMTSSLISYPSKMEQIQGSASFPFSLVDQLILDITVIMTVFVQAGAAIHAHQNPIRWMDNKSNKLLVADWRQ